jgi:microcystin degradation protein MlrC
MKCFMAYLAHETNSFSPIPTDLSSFEEVGIYRPAVGAPAQHMGLLKGVADFLRVAQRRGDEAVVGLCALAQPSLPCLGRDYVAMRDEILAQLAAAGPVDMVLLFMHGSMMAQGCEDCEGDMLERVRALVGPAVPVGVLLDLHCNVTPAMVRHATIIKACKEYPHTDFAARAEELYELVAATAAGKVRPAMAFRRVPMLGLFQTTREPMRSFVDDVLATERSPGVLSITLAHGFPWADFAHTGAGVIAITDGDLPLAQRLADHWGRQFFALREAGQVEGLAIGAALDAALARSTGTVVIADMSDNPGGGAASDSTFLLRAMLERGVRDAAVGLLWDPVAVRLAFAAGEGAVVPLRIGGKLGPGSGAPIDVEVIVKHLRTDASQPHIADGSATALGRTAVVEACGIDVVLNEIRQQPFHPDAFVGAGVDPWSKRVVVVKSSFHFNAGFAERAAAVLYCDAPGTLGGDARLRPYRHITRPIWPLDEVKM